MNIIITLAGKSKRFYDEGYTKPKFLLEIDGKPMILHIADMFSTKDKFYFIFNNNQLRNNPEIYNIIETNVLNFEIISIKEHSEGPVYSAYQVKSISADEPVIITYCDFFVEWNYEKFKNEAINYDMAIPSFKGFHPASFGETTYAYSKVNSDNELVMLKEKESFTNNRKEEYANSGIYYFKTWKTFKENTSQLIKKGYGPLKEGYVSLIANYILNNGGKVLVTEVRKFICWGTPKDYEIYRFWSECFLQKEFNAGSTVYADLNLIPMAGLGSRFKNESYNVLKPLIQIGKKSMFTKASDSFPNAKKWIFIFTNSLKINNSNLLNEINKRFVNNYVKLINEPTSGQAATCLTVKEEINKNASLFIASCDYVSVFNKSKWKECIKDIDIDAFVWTVKANNIIVRDPKAFAYCKINKKNNLVERIVEKELISETPEKDNLVIGSFWFRKGSTFVQAAENAITNDENVNGEHYIGNSLNFLINKGLKIKIFEVKQWISFGDPFELEIYYYWEDFFYNRYNKKNPY